MNEKALKTLEFNKIVDKLVQLAGSGLGKELCSSILPYNNIDEIRLHQQETSDGLARILRRGSLGFYGLHEIRPSLMRLDIGSTLSAVELLHIRSVLDAILRIKSYGIHEEDSELNDSLEPYFTSLEPLTPLKNEINRCIIGENEFADDASPTLKNIRRNIINTNDKIHSQLTSIMSAANSKNILQDNLITMRNGRYCLPIKQEYRSNFPGMIHDQSSSGSTVFIEPIAVVKLNNDLKDLALKEQEEIEKILSELSSMTAEHIETLKSNLEIAVKLDLIFAKASLSKLMKGSEPKFNTEGIIHIKKARHPLINPKEVVPIDIRLGDDFNMLIITGPNTGGKTVSLKTVGLLTLMGQAGLHIPAFEGSRLAVFEEVYADIGDEQSIEQSLSTFSSHMTNTVSILENANEKSLVLFDELGAGTDPTEGAALAMSILDYFHQRQIRTMATTHYSELKVYALSTPGISNAACEFDVESLRPTYRLLIGIPGKSNAFAISSKLGLPEHIIQNAQTKIGNDNKSFEELISDLESKRLIMEEEQEEITRSRNDIEKLRSRLKDKNEKLEKSREKILNEAREEARKTLQEAKDYADETIKKYNKWSAEHGLHKDMEKERGALREKLSKVTSDTSLGQSKRPQKKHKASDFHLGDAVNVLSMGLKGTISTLPNDKGDLFVQMGILKSKVNIKDLELIEESTVTAPTLNRTNSGKIKISKSSSIRPEINLIGKTVDEALPELDKYLDDAYLSHLPQVQIIHGRGTGALKNAVHSHLKKSKYIKSFRIGEFGEGGQGVTIAEFK